MSAQQATATETWWCDMRSELEPEPGDLAKLFFDVAFRQPDPRPGRGNFCGFPNDVEYAWALVQSFALTDWPCEREDRLIWVAAFRSAGFVVDGVRRPEARPAQPMELHRASALHDLREGPGLAWCASREDAEVWARHHEGLGRRAAGVFTATVEPGQLLGRITASPGAPAGDTWLADVRTDQMR